MRLEPDLPSIQMRCASGEFDETDRMKTDRSPFTTFGSLPIKNPAPESDMEPGKDFLDD